tara:strand:+ start:1103 stop:2233 length:1131 start_codon:yes stop_codon:yes gene_type:complete
MPGSSLPHDSRVRPFPRVAFVSSHLGRWPHRRTDWFAALSTACNQLLDENSRLLLVAGTTTAPYLTRCGELFGHRVETLDSTGVSRGDRDQLSVFNADVIIALAVGNRSRTRTLIQQVLETPSEGRPPVWFARSTSLVSREITEKWTTLGARPFDPASRRRSDPPIAEATVHLATNRMVKSGDWLVHCTRECDGRWPGQSQDQYLDDLILGRSASDHSVQATLRKILVERRLRAASRPVRGFPPAVSFSASPLEELLTRRVFRGHRGRWDFEPYGLAISRDWLAARGARPVVYRLPGDLRGNDPFEQPTGSQGRHPMNWTREEEWRHPGDVDLSSLPDSQGLVLVHRHSDLGFVSGISRWPVLVLGHFRQDTSAVQ